MNRYNTPLRYPGGKQKLSPFMLELMLENELAGGHYVEPYAGGAGIAIELLLSGSASHVHLNDACRGVYAFWRSVLDHPEQMCRRISLASLTIAEWRRQQAVYANASRADRLELGFSVLYLNRCNRSGILSGGLIGGLHQSGEWTMDVRFPRKELIRRIETIALHSSRITVTNQDAERYIHQVVPRLPRETLVYLDPPYFHKAQRLYLNHYQPKDHQRLAGVVQRNLARPWVVSYDAVPAIAKAYRGRRSIRYSLQYNAAKAYIGDEMIFFDDQLQMPANSSHASINRGLKRCASRSPRARSNRALRMTQRI